MSKSSKSINPKKSTQVKYRKDALAAKINNFIKHGRKEITTQEELEKFPIGCIISYTNRNNHFKQGGFIIKFADEYFIYITHDFSTKYRVRYVNISKMWVGNVFKIRNDFISFTTTTQKKTKFPVELNGIIIYYGASSYDVTRFMNTDRYKNLFNWYKYFIDTD